MSTSHCRGCQHSRSWCSHVYWSISSSWIWGSSMLSLLDITRLQLHYFWMVLPCVWHAVTSDSCNICQIWVGCHDCVHETSYYRSIGYFLCSFNMDYLLHIGGSLIFLIIVLASYFLSFPHFINHCLSHSLNVKHQMTFVTKGINCMNELIRKVTLELPKDILGNLPKPIRGIFQ